MSQSQSKLIVNHTFQGGRFADHGVDIDVLEEITRYKNLLVETAKALWRKNHPDRERLRKNFEDGLRLKFYEVKSNCATIPLCRQVMSNEQGEMFQQSDELDEAVALLAQVIKSANLDQPLPAAFPRRLIALFADYGKSLGDGEWIEQTPRGWNEPVRYDEVVRVRLQRLADSAYEDHVDLTGTVTMARISKPRMAIELSDGREIEAAFRAGDEETITTALKDHVTAKVRVIGKGLFSGDGQLQRLMEISTVTLLVGGVEAYDSAAKPIWEQFAEIVSKVPAEEWAKLPTDRAENHDRYISKAQRAD